MKKTFLIALILCLSSQLFASTVDTVSIFSDTMHKNIKCVVIKPNTYAQKNKRFPVVYLLHGYSDNYAFWVNEIPSIKQYADDFQMILVCPDGGYNSWYLDSPVNADIRYETHISKEVLNYVDAHYHTIPNREHRAITGLSMGGHGAFYIALKHSNLFGAVGSTSGGVDMSPFKKRWQLTQQLGDSITHQENWKNNTIINMIDHYPTDSLAIIFDCGTEDFFYTVNKNLHEKMLKLHIQHDYIERPGGHTIPYWQNSIPYQLLFFSRYFSKSNTDSDLKKPH
ncbi:esterase family protein [Pelobium sp.]|nr:alpha/beta hydrolase family protein [Pelobium sp.]MDA9554727.1 esterase family protein [Pelobium sp.]